MLKQCSCGLLLLAFLSIIAGFGLVMAGNELAKEEHVSADARMVSAATGTTVQVDRAISLSSLWDAPALAPKVMSRLSELKCFVDMTTVSKFGSWVEVSFRVGSVLQPIGREDVLYITSVDGSEIEINNATRVATVLMPKYSTERMTISGEEPAAARRARLLRNVQAEKARETRLFSASEWAANQAKDVYEGRSVQHAPNRRQLDESRRSSSATYETSDIPERYRDPEQYDCRFGTNYPGEWDCSRKISSMSGGEIAGMVIGILAGCVCLCCALAALGPDRLRAVP
jgi:hypothetical protein